MRIGMWMVRMVMLLVGSGLILTTLSALADKAPYTAVAREVQHDVNRLSDENEQTARETAIDREVFGSASAGGCDCPCWADPNCDGIRSDVLDVTSVVNVAFRGVASITDPGCPTARQDVDCDGLVTICDVIRVVNVAFRGMSVASQFCDPCAPSPQQSQPALPPGPYDAKKIAAVYDRLASEGQLANSVLIESKTVAPGATNVEIGVYIANAVPLVGLVLSLEIRTVSGGAYMASGGFSRGTNPAGRLENSPLGAADGGGAWPGAVVTQRTYAVEVATVTGCESGSGASWNTPAMLPDFISPDAVLHATVSTGDVNIGDDIDLDPGSDPPGVPSYRFIFDVNSALGTFVIDTCCVAPANHLAFAENLGACDYSSIIAPTFVPGTITIGSTTDCAINTTADPFLVTCPLGDAPYRVRLKDGLGDPIIGYSGLTLDFSACDPGELIPVPGKHPTWPIVHPTAPSNNNGVVTFNVFAGGNCADCEVTVTADCGFSAVVPVHSFDTDGDLCVNLNDDFFAAPLACRDFNNTGDQGGADDFGVLLGPPYHPGHCAPLSPCDLIAIQAKVLPETDLSLGDEITIEWELHNLDNVGVCDIDSVVFYHFDCVTSTTLNKVALQVVDQLLMPGAQISGQVSYLNPDALDFCVEARYYSNCCEPYGSQVLPVTVQTFCSVIGSCVEFYCTPLSITAVNTVLPPGWTHNVTVINDHEEFGTVTRTLICTGPSPVQGQTGTVVIEHDGPDYFTKVYSFKFEASMGDVCGRTADCGELPNQLVPNCVIDVLDVVCMINYIFRGDVPPCPVDNVDLNCDCVANVVDIVTIVNTAFRGQPPPPRCDEDDCP